MLAEPGMPNISVGMSWPPLSELLADSGAMTPRMSPLPKLVRSFVVCTMCS
jgi:hypothetical protein